jgi:hypothetical protein
VLSTRDLAATIDILSAMITPAVLILASGSLVLTTSNRLSRVIDRVRELAAELSPSAGGTEQIRDPERRTLIADLLKRSVARARLLQRALASLYWALSLFVATSISIGIMELFRFGGAWIVLLFGMAGSALLLSSSMLLIAESRRAMVSVFREMDFLEKRGTVHGVLEATDKAQVESERKEER